MVAKGIAVQKAFGISQDKRADRCRDLAPSEFTTRLSTLNAAFSASTAF